jgi:hypothetical protein
MTPKEKSKDQWDEINYPELTKDENQIIRKARRLGFADFYPSFPNAETQSKNTLNGAIKYLNEKEN